MKTVLVTNDDGIEAKGLTDLVEALSPYADVYVAAPMEQQSAKSHSITFMREVGVKEADLKGAVSAYAVDGTPADCVKIGLVMMEAEGLRPDYIFSGINLGMNLGLAAYYSGTIAAAREGAINGIRSIALSLGTFGSTRFDYLLGMLPRIMEMADKVSPSTIISVNAPDLPSWEIKGVRVVPAAPYGYGEDFIFTHMGGGSYQLMPIEARMDGRKRYDYDWVDEGYVTVSPLPTTLSDPAALNRLKEQVRSADCLAVVLDAQEGMMDRIRKPGRFRKNIGRFVHAAGRMDMPVIIAGTFGLGETINEVKGLADGAETIERILPDAWTSPDLENLMSVIDADKVLIAGAATNTSVLRTAAGFVDRAYEVVILEDCCASSSKKDHKLAISDLRESGCHISTCETEIMKLAADCGKAVRESVERILYI